MIFMNSEDGGFLAFSRKWFKFGRRPDEPLGWVNPPKLPAIFKTLEKHLKELDRISRQRTRMAFAHPDLCIFLSNYPRWFDHKYMIKKGAKKGHWIVSLGWLRFSVAW